MHIATARIWDIQYMKMNRQYNNQCDKSYWFDHINTRLSADLFWKNICIFDRNWDLSNDNLETQGTLASTDMILMQ